MGKHAPLKLFLISFFVIFFSWIFVYKTGINRLVVQSEDTIPAIFLSATIIKEKTLYLDSYYNLMIQRYPQPDDKDQKRGLTPYYLEKVGSHYLSAFPIITPLISLPVFYIPIKLGMPVNWDNMIFLSKISSILIVSFSGMLMFILLKKHFLDEKKSLILTVAYIFGTVNFAMISQSMWQHGTLELFSLLGIYFILNYINDKKKKFSDVFLSGLFFGLAILSRPTALLGLAFIMILVFVKSENLKTFSKAALFALAGLSLCLLFFLWYNNKYYIGIQNQGYVSQLSGSWGSPFPLSMIGVWLSPSKGILIYSPIFFFSLIGFWVAMKKGWHENIQYLIYFLIMLFHTFIISLWKHWYGGYSFGYRMSSDIIPYLIFLVVPFLKSEFYGKYKKIFLAVLVFSILVQVGGMFFFDSIWHSAYDQGNKNTAWLWSIKDSEFMFNVRRVLVKLNLLDKACPKCL
jgi:hypothetical protein